MSAQCDEDLRVKAPKPGEYQIQSVGTGQIACYRPGMQLIDFYRTTDVLAKDVKGKDE